MELIDDKIPSPVLSFTPTRIEDSTSYVLEDDLELDLSLNFDNPSNAPHCLIHSIPMNYVWSLEPQISHWKCPICEPNV